MRQPLVSFPRHQRGAAMIEYAIVTAVGVLVLVAEPDIILELVESMRNAYQGFTYMLSMGIV